ncbi:hypothetical protein F5Y00DRAFT_268553 [Daldinia vernicosa]|uniref:uncharacterized protein n=1 Tax=Daldinia vernicosa TaxID=114800 RepID=UPI002007C06C|nr:uncharacterized protein F5Y00DRAFT_268553 [Daldinia vernicosa]KAI0850437.1 hypothetical protein F5Y00DRAFT_268553 [Daldinia vernicosa]
MRSDAESLLPVSASPSSHANLGAVAIPESEAASLLFSHDKTMLIHSVEQWYSGTIKNQKILSDWFVVKVEHMKNFHYSIVFHEYLRVTLQRRKDDDQEKSGPRNGLGLQRQECTIFVERGPEEDEVIVGCELHEVPRLYGWWIVRFLRGNYNGAMNNNVKLTQKWKEMCYSASDFLRCLEFDLGVVSLCYFAKVISFWSKSRAHYHVAKANCYWFADIVYTQLKHDRKGTLKETEGGYVKHRSKFSGLRILFNSVSLTIP